MLFRKIVAYVVNQHLQVQVGEEIRFEPLPLEAKGDEELVW